MNRITVMLLAALFAGCSDQAQPTGTSTAEQEAPLQLSPQVSVALTEALIPVEDALVRVFEDLPHGPAHKALGAALAALHEALEAGKNCAIRTGRRDAERALRDLSSGQPGEFEADFEVVKLALGSIEESGEGECR